MCHIVEHLVCYIDLLYLFLEFQHLIPGNYGLCIFQGIFLLSVP